MKIAHATDIHWFVPPKISEVWNKRLVGSANLYLRGRRHHFSSEVQAALVEHVLQLQPDAFVISGDLTAQATQEEFRLARSALDPILQSIPTFMVGGNHDFYTAESVSSGRMQEFFGTWMGLQPPDPVGRLELGDLVLLGLDPNRSTWLSAAGLIPPEQLRSLEVHLSDPALASKHVILVLHYPVVDRRGDVYDGASHGLLNASELITLLERVPRRPDAILHGHIHHGYASEIGFTEGKVLTFNCGSSGYAHEPHHDRAAAMNVYTLGETLSVERYRYNGASFSPEQGGAYATGR